MSRLAMNTLPTELINYQLGFSTDHNISLVMLSLTSKQFYAQCANFAKERKIKKHVSGYHVARLGYSNIFQLLEDQYNKSDINIFIGAAENGDLTFLKWLHSKGYLLNRWTTNAAARLGHLRVIKWLHKNGCPIDSLLYVEAAKKGDVKTCIWAFKQNIPWSQRAHEVACKNGHLNILVWTDKKKIVFSSPYICISLAAKYGHLDIVQWIDEKYCKLYKSDEVCANAAWGGHLRTVHCSKISRDRMEHSTRGHLKVLMWARNNLYTWDSRTCKKCCRWR